MTGRKAPDATTCTGIAGRSCQQKLRRSGYFPRDVFFGFFTFELTIGALTIGVGCQPGGGNPRARRRSSGSDQRRSLMEKRQSVTR